MKKFITMLTALLVVGLAGSASAAVMTFDDLEVAGTGINNVGTSYSSDGFTITQGNGEPHFLSYFEQGEGRYLNSAALFNNTVNGVMTLTADSASLFTLNAIDLDLLNNVGSANVHFYAFDAGDTIVADLSYDLTADGWNTVNFGSGFSDIAYVQWAQTADFHQFDNVTLDATAVVPLPAAAPMALLGMGLVGLVRRTRRSKKVA